MTTPSTHLSGHVHGEEAVEIVARAVEGLDWFEEHGGTDPSYEEIAAAAVAALTAAGLLATEQEWGVRYAGSEFIDCDSEQSAQAEAANFRGTVVSRGVTAWREQA